MTSHLTRIRSLNKEITTTPIRRSFSILAFSLPLLAGLTACGSSSSGGGASDVSWKDVLSKKVDPTTACKDLFGAHDADAAKKVAASALATAPASVTIRGELDGDSGDGNGSGDENLRCNFNDTPARFYPSDEADNLTTDDSVTASANGFGVEAHAGAKGPGMQAVLAAAVAHLKL